MTAVGAPAYTSGVQEWNGTAPNLNSSPIPISPMPASSMPEPCALVAIDASISARVNEPEYP